MRFPLPYALDVIPTLGALDRGNVWLFICGRRGGR